MDLKAASLQDVHTGTTLDTGHSRASVRGVEQGTMASVRGVEQGTMYYYDRTAGELSIQPSYTC